MPNLSSNPESDDDAELMISPPPASGWRRWQASTLPLVGRLVGFMILAAMLIAGCWWFVLWWDSIKIP